MLKDVISLPPIFSFLIQRTQHCTDLYPFHFLTFVVTSTYFSASVCYTIILEAPAIVDADTRVTS